MHQTLPEKGFGATQHKPKGRFKGDVSIIKPVKSGKNIQIITQQQSPSNSNKLSRTPTNLSKSADIGGYYGNSKNKNKYDYRATLSREQLRVVNEDLFDQIIEGSLQKPINFVFEPIVQQMFMCEKCVLWIDCPEQKCLIAPSYNAKAGYDNSLPGFIFRTKSTIQVRDPSNAPNGFKSDPKIVSQHSPQLLFALTVGNCSKAVVQIIQFPNSPSFTRLDIDTANLLISKFAIYGESIFTSQSISSIAETLYSYNVNSINPMELLKHHFNCDACEVWQFDNVRKVGQRILSPFNRSDTLNFNECGIVGFAISNQKTVNLLNVANDPAYNQLLDGSYSGPILIVPYDVTPKEPWAIVLRGRKAQFSASDEARLRAFFPFVYGSLTGFNSACDQKTIYTQLNELSKISLKLTSKISRPFSEIIKIIQRESINIIDCNSCSIFLLDKSKKKMICYSMSIQETSENSSYSLKLKTKIPLGKGICSHVIQTREAISLLNPADSPYYDPQVDVHFESLPSSILVSPILDCEKEIIGCIELLSKKNGDRFTENDQKVITALNVFIGIAIENSQKYKNVIKLTQKLQDLTEILCQVNGEIEISKLLNQIFDKIKQIFKAVRLTYFIEEYNSNLCILYNFGEANHYNNIFSKLAQEKRKMMIFNSSQVFEMMSHINNNQTRFHNISSNNIQKMDIQSALPSNKETLCCIPLINQDSKLLGVLEITFFDSSSENIDLMNYLSSICLLSFSKIMPKNIQNDKNISVDEWISQDEKTQYIIPKKLIFPNDVFTLSFHANDYDDFELIKVVYKIFERFELLQTYKISSESLFNFLIATMKTYSSNSSYDWKHAIDTIQFSAYQIIIGKLDKEYIGKFEILSLLIAALLHDSNHNNFCDIQREISNIPLEIFFRKMSIMELSHCKTAIGIFLKDNCNIFENLSREDSKTILNMIFKLILATDMRRHFKIVWKLKSLLTHDYFNAQANFEHRFLLMKCLIKIADISNIIRPFSTKNNWTTSIADEFFIQGDIKRTPEMIFNSSDEDYDHLDKEASLMGFFKSVCLPLVQAVSSAIPDLKMHSEILRENFQNWARSLNRNITF